MCLALAQWRGAFLRGGLLRLIPLPKTLFQCSQDFWDLDGRKRAFEKRTRACQNVRFKNICALCRNGFGTSWKQTYPHWIFKLHALWNYFELFTIKRTHTLTLFRISDLHFQNVRLTLLNCSDLLPRVRVFLSTGSVSVLLSPLTACVSQTSGIYKTYIVTIHKLF